MRRPPAAVPGHRTADADRHRLAALGRPFAGAQRARAVAAAPVRDDRPRVVAGALLAGGSGAATALWADARTIASIAGAAYAHEPIQVTRTIGSPAARARNDACVPLTHWVCDGLAELEAIAVLLGCARLGELDAAIAEALDHWRTHGGDAVPRTPRLAPAVDGVLGALQALCLRGATGDEALAAVAPIVELIELMRGPLPSGSPLVPESAPLARAAAAVRSGLAAHRDELTRIGAAIDRVAGHAGGGALGNPVDAREPGAATAAPGDRIAVALGVAARVHQLAVIADAITAWIDGTGAATAAQARWRGAAAAVEQVFAGTLAGVRQLVPLPP